MFRRIALAFAAALLVAAVGLPMPKTTSAQRSPILAVIVHPDIRIRSLDADELRSIFTMRRRHWDGGERVVPFNLPTGHGQRNGFDSSVLRMSENQVSRYWIDRRIRGGSRPPRQAPSEEIMARVIGRLPGAIGYVRTNFVNRSVRVVALVRDGQVRAP